MRRTSAAVLTALLLPTTLLSVPAGAATDAPPAEQRFDGDTRYDTSRLLAEEAFPTGATTAVIARGTDFPDGLAASYLAGVLDAPILLAAEDVPIPQPTIDAISVLNITEVVLVGGDSALSPAVEAKFEELLGADNVDRVSGSTRTFTAVAVAQAGGGQVGTITDLSGATSDPKRTAILAYARNFPDALAAGVLAFAGNHPLLLTATDDLPTETALALQDGTLDIEQVVLVGGPSVISPAVEQDVRDLGLVAHRVAGLDRTETAVKLAELTDAALGWGGAAAALTTGRNYPDALALAPLAAKRRAPIFLTSTAESVGPATFAALQGRCAGLTALLIAGGNTAVTEDAVGEASLAGDCADHTFAITPDQEPDGGQAGVTGTGWVWQGEPCYAAVLTGMVEPFTAAHVHEAAAGSNGPVRSPINTPGANGFTVGCLGDPQLDADIAADPTAFYLNFHNASFPGGATRGQLG